MNTKKDVIRHLVDSCSVVRLYVDPRQADVTVPQHLKSQEWLCLDVGLPGALVRPIHDLEISEWGVHGTLSFGGSPYYCSVSYTAIHGAKHLTSGGIVSWVSAATAALREDAPPAEVDLAGCPAIGVGGYHSSHYADPDDGVCQWCGDRASAPPTEQKGAKVIDLAAWRRARGR